MLKVNTGFCDETDHSPVRLQGLNLGILYNSRGNHEKSVELLEQHFDLAR